MRAVLIRKRYPLEAEPERHEQLRKRYRQIALRLGARRYRAAIYSIIDARILGADERGQQAARQQHSDDEK